MKITADIIKTAVLSYYRYQRQMICTDECWCGISGETCDVLVDSGKYFYDIEIKINKYDLWKGEAKKRKHYIYNRAIISDHLHHPNYFLICVPSSLINEAQKWVQETNTNYGIIEFSEDLWNRMGKAKCFWRFEDLIRIKRNPKKLRENRGTRLSEALVKRLCSAYTTLRQKNLRKGVCG